MRFLKIKQTSDNKIRLVYEVLNKNNSWDEFSMTCSDQARPDFYEAFNNIAAHVIDMCELPENYLPRIEVKGVSFSYGGEAEVMGATISSQMMLNYSNCKLNLNTPHKASGSYNENPPDDFQVLSDDCITALENLCEEAELYIKGDRAQGKLFNDVA